MCYSALVKRDLKVLEKRFGAVAVREQYEDYDYRSRKDPKSFPKLGPRIYPGNYAPVIHFADEGKRISLMRYNVDPPSFIPEPKKYTTYNARRDNLTSKFWSESFMRNHGIIVIQAFYEWVEVKDLLRAGVVTIDQVKDEFRRQSEQRKAKIVEQGKKYAPTATEKVDPHFRKIILEFKPDSEDILVPVIFSVKDDRMGFAIVTDDPLPEVAAAGHDRTPISLTEKAAELWLKPEGMTAAVMLSVLEKRAANTFRHALPETIAA